VETHRKLFFVVVGVELGPQIDVALARRSAAKYLRTSCGSGAPVIIDAIMNVVSITLRKPSCSAK